MSIREITPQEGKKLLESGWMLVDVRSPGEWSSIHAQGAQNLPLDKLSAENITNVCGTTKKIITICHSGGRSARACETLSALPGFEVVSLSGGTSRWEAEGLPVVRGKGVISIERQVRIGAGVMVFVGTLMGIFLHNGFLALPLFVGAGLTFAGVTDFCGMGIVLAKMPWNQGLSTSCAR